MADRTVPRLTSAERRAAVVKKVLDAAASRIPGLKAPHKETARRMRGHRTVPRKFIRSMIGTVDAVEELQAMNMFDVDDAEAALEFEAAFRPLIDQLTILLASLSYTIDLRMSPIAKQALRTYVVAKALARSESNRTLTERLRFLKRDLGRKGPGKKKKK